MRKIKKLKRISIMLLCVVLLHGGCGSRTTEETEKVDTTENFDLIGTEGWEYQGEKKQYIYGEWTVTGVRKGDTWDETDERVGAVYELLPESCSYKSSTESYSLKLEGYSASLISVREYDIAGMLPQDTDYCLEFSEVEMGRKYAGIKSAFTVLILIGENEIIGREDGNWCRLEKTTDYNDMPEGKDFLIPISGIWNGEWEVTEILKEDGDDAEQYIGADFSTWFQEILEEKFCNFYIVSTREPSIKQLVKAMGLEKETFVGFYEFSDDFYWDKMIVKDEMTAILVKDGNYLWARRTSKRDQHGVYDYCRQIESVFERHGCLIGNAILYPGGICHSFVALDWKKNGELVIYDPWDGNIGTYTIDEAFYTGFLSAQGKGILKWVQYIV